MVFPISQGRSESIPSFVRRYQQRDFNELPPEILRPLMQLDYNRAIRGQTPVPKNRIPLLARALQTGEAQAAPDKKSFFERFREDVATLGRSIPQLPMAIIKEARALPTAPQEIQQALQSGDLSKVFEAPGIRLLPGSYIAAEGRGALEHPLFAALDIAPYTKMAFERAAATAPGKAALARVGETADRFGVGPISRLSARLTAQGNRTLAIGLNEYGARIKEIEKRYGLSREDVARLTTIGTRDPYKIQSLPANERSYLNEIRRESDLMADKMVDLGVAGRYDGELYPLHDYNWFTAQQDKITAAVDAGDLKKADTLRKAFQEKYNRTPPLRYRPVLLEHYQRRLTALARSRIPEDSVELWNEVSRDISEGFWDRAVPTVSRKEMRELSTEIAPTWMGMKQAGLDPILLQTVTPEQAAHLARPSLFVSANYTPLMVRQGMWDVKPGINDFSVGLGFAEYEYLRKVTTDAVIKEIENNPLLSRTKREVQDLHLAAIRERGTRPGMSVPAELQEILKRDWVEWNPNSIFTHRAPRQMTGLMEKAEPRYVHKAFADAVDAIYRHQNKQWLKAYDTTMKVFKTSILPLSPRWHVYNMIGGAVLMMGRADPTIWKYFGDAVRMVRDNRLPVGLSRGFFDISEANKLYEFDRGRTLGRWAQERETVGAGVRKASEQTVGRLWQMAEKVDEFYRALSYLYGQDKALKKGMTREQAVEAGVKLSNKVLQDWDSMVPFERQVLRTIFPFYGWMRHILNYAFTYPWDHPYRASIISNFARNELEDWQTGLPAQFQEYLGLPGFLGGGKDAQGNERVVNVGGANPFGDVHSYFTFWGFVSQLNPVAKGLLEAAGVNTQTGKADLYPEVFYNAETGRLEPKTKPAPQAVLENILPPLTLAGPLLGFKSKEQKELQAANPQAYRSMVASAAGIPFVPRTINRQLEIGRAELRRQDAMQDAFTNALKTGDWSEAYKYPQLRPVLDFIREQMAAGNLDPLALQAQPTGILDPAQLLEGLGQ